MSELIELNKELACYVSDYINEELERGNLVDYQTIFDAVEAFTNGAR